MLRLGAARRWNGAAIPSGTWLLLRSNPGSAAIPGHGYGGTRTPDLMVRSHRLSSTKLHTLGGRRELNPRMMAPQTITLPLGDARRKYYILHFDYVKIIGQNVFFFLYYYYDSSIFTRNFCSPCRFVFSSYNNGFYFSLY